MTMKPFRSAVVCLALVCACATPAFAVDREHQQIMADIRMLQEQAQQLQALLTGLGDALKQVNSRLDEQSALERKAFADGKVQMDNASGDLRIVREKVDETNVRLSSLAQEMEALRASLPQPGATAPAPTTSDATQPAGIAAPAAMAPPAPPTAGQTPQRLYDQSYSDYSMGQYPLAVQGFESFLKYYPKSDLADDAQFYIGESNFHAGKFADAAAAYSRVIANYPGGNTVPLAFYKQGMALESIPGQTDAAKQSYETVIKQFPDSQAAILAKQALDRLNGPAR
jgi:tol-pal system protein YbgF